MNQLRQGNEAIERGDKLFLFEKITKDQVGNIYSVCADG
jgi:hypothetical protein